MSHVNEVIVGVVGSWDVWLKYGDKWSYWGEVKAKTSNEAALKISYTSGRKYIRVRPAGSHKGFIYRLRRVPSRRIIQPG